MSTLYSAEYYRKNFRYFNKSKKAIKPEEQLASLMLTFDDPENYTAEAYAIIQKVMATQVYEKIKADLKQQQAMIIDLKAGKCSLGYTTQTQEIHAKSELIQMFEFNCLKLADFKRTYKLEV